MFVIEEKLFKIFKENERNGVSKSEKVHAITECIEKEIINERKKIRPVLLELLNNNNQILNIAIRLSNKLFTFYKSKGIKIRDQEKSTLIMSRIIMTLCYELTILENQRIIDKKEYTLFLKEMLKLELGKLVYYLKEEFVLGSYFEEYN